KAVKFGDASTRLAIITDVGDVDVWDLTPTPRLAPAFPVAGSLPGGLNDPASLPAFRHGTRVVQHQADVTWWDIDGERQTQAITLTTSYNTGSPPDATLSPDGQTLVLVDPDTGVQTVPLDPASWRQQLCAMVTRDMTAAE